jgi:phage terminase large subunit-like protein
MAKRLGLPLVWGVKENQLHLLHAYRKRVSCPDLKRAVREQAVAFQAQTILIEDRAPSVGSWGKLVDWLLTGEEMR